MVAQRHIDEMESRRSAKSSIASGIETLLKKRMHNKMTQHLVWGGMKSGYWLILWRQFYT